MAESWFALSSADQSEAFEVAAAGRGRPPGAKARVVQVARPLGIHHFAFVRASLLGVDLREDFTCYLARAVGSPFVCANKNTDHLQSSYFNIKVTSK